MGVVGNGAAMAPATIVLTRNAPQTLAQHLSAASMEPLVPSPEAMSTFFTPLPPSKYRYYSPSQKHLDAMGTPLGSASAPGFAGDGDGVGFTIKTEKKEVRPLNLREAMSSEQRLLQNEQYRTVVQAKLRVAKAIMEKADLKQQTRYQKILMPTGITRSTNTSSMCTTTNRIISNIAIEHDTKVEIDETIERLQRVRTNENIIEDVEAFILSESIGSGPCL